MAIVQQEFVIAAGEKESQGEVNIGKYSDLALIPPSTLDSANLTFKAWAGGDSYVDLYKTDGSAKYTITGVAGAAIPLDPEIFRPFRGIKLVSSETQTGVEAALVTTVATGKTLTFTSGVGGEDANNLTVTIETADDDNLAASIDGYDLLIKLASQTANKNTAALIEDAVQALADTGSVDLTAMTVVGNTAYNAAPLAGTVATKAITVATGKTLIFATVLKGAQYNGITVTMETADDDNLAVSAIDDTDGILIKLANTTASKNSAANIQTALQAVAATDASSFDISGMTVTGNAAYNAAPLAGVKASKQITVDTGKALTFTSGVVGTASNAIKITIDENDENALAVSAADGVITILLATTTAASNAADAIQAAIRAIEGGTVGGISVAAFTVAGDTGYNAAPVTALGDGITVSEVALANGADSIADGVVSAVALASGTDSIAAGVVDGVNLENGDDCHIKVMARD